MSELSALFQSAWSITLALAPWLFLGAGVAAVLHVLLPAGLIARQFQGVSGVLKAVLLGVPLPLCSCGVIPAGLSLKKHGASSGSAVGFLISTPQTGVDSVFVSASFLGWPFAVFKVLSAAALGIVGGVWADRVGGSRGPEPEPDHAACGTARCEVVETSEAEEAGSSMGRKAWAHGVLLVRSIWRWLVIGIVISAAITTWVPAEAVSAYGAFSNVWTLLLVLLVSVPLYVCATASVPIAAALVGAGFSSGAALVFLMAGPATNVATLGAVFRTLGGRALAVYLATIVLGSLGLAWMFDSLLSADVALDSMHHDQAEPWRVASAVALWVAIGWFAWEDLRGAIPR